MSYNTHLYFADAEFPREQWDEILTLFDVEPRELIRSSVNDPPSYLAEWIVRDKGAAVWCSLSTYKGEYPSSQNPQSSITAHYFITTDSTRNPKDLLCVANLAYAVLSWISNTTFDDLNGHVCRTPDELLEIYIPHLAKRFAAGNFNKMFEAGILDYDGKLNF